MLKYSICIFLLAVAIYSPSVEARPKKTFISLNHNRDGSRGALARALKKRDISISSGEEEEFEKQLLASILLMTAQSSAEVDDLTLKFKKALEKEHESIDAFAEDLGKIYKEVTGREPGEGVDSDELFANLIE